MSTEIRYSNGMKTVICGQAYKRYQARDRILGGVVAIRKGTLLGWRTGCMAGPIGKLP